MKKRRKPARAGLRVVAGGAAAAVPPAAAALAPAGPEQLSEDEIREEQARIRERSKLIDKHRGQRSELVKRQAQEAADLITRHLEEERALERAQAADVAKLWREQRRQLGPGMLRILGETS